VTAPVPPWRYAIREGVGTCTPAELDLLDKVYRESVTGVAWWRLLEETYQGTPFRNVHVFFYRGSGSEPPCAQFSAQYFPCLPLTPYLSLPPALGRALRAAGRSGLSARCFIVHSLSSVQSVFFRADDAEPFVRAMERSIASFRGRHPVHIALIRSLEQESTQTLERHLVRRGWSFVPGHPCNHYRLEGHGSLQGYLSRFHHKRRWEHKKSMRRLTADARVKTLRVRTPGELAPYVPEICELKRQTVLRKREGIPIPLHERPEFFTRCLAEYGDNAYFLLLVRDENRLLGYNLTVAAGPRARGLSLCVRYPEGKPVDAWFNLSLAMLDALARAGVRDINVGQGDDEIKAKLGASRRNLFSAVTFHPALLRVLCKTWLVPRLRRI